jgi:hypothetical protein
MSIGSWSFKRVLLLSGVWLIASFTFLLWRGYQAYQELSHLPLERGGGGVGAVSTGLLEFLISVGLPPIPVFVAVWYVLRRRHERGQLK